MTGHVYTVEALTAQINGAITAAFPLVWVRGEVTNLSLPQSGHIYFTLKDAAAQLQCVWFARRQSGTGRTFDPFTGEVYAQPRPEPRVFMRNGLDLLCAGAVAVYAARGQYQLVVETAEPAGSGVLALELERRKNLLAARGFFSPGRKRPLPPNPVRIALITSPHGAAIHDFLKVAAGRGLSASVRLFPVLVQGTEAAPQIAAAIAEANEQGWAQVIVVIRGGGSLEDLWAFNEEVVAEAIFASGLPVLAGIGHEVDTSLADMTADVRAATPTHAAQLLLCSRGDLWQRLDGAQIAIDRCMFRRLERAEEEAKHMLRALSWLSPARELAHMEERLTGLLERLERETVAIMDGAARRLSHTMSLWRKAPRLRQSIALAMHRTARLREAVPTALARSLLLRQKDLDATLEKLEAMNPYAPLKRGYALLLADDKGAGVVSSVSRAETGQKVKALLADGQLLLQVLAKQDCPREE